MVETNRMVHVIFYRKIAKKVGNLLESRKPMHVKVTCKGLYIDSKCSATSYQYLFFGLLVTGFVAYGVLPRLMSLVSSKSFLVSGILIGTLAGITGFDKLTRSIPYENTLAKNAAFAAHAGFMGFVIAPMVAMFGDVVAQAALYTAGMVGGIR